jgi:hypothetical protein
MTMSYFAQVNESGIVVQVIAISQEMIDTGLWGDPSTWFQTSYNTRGGVHYGQDGQPDGGVALRKNYAGIGSIYDKDRDAFYTPQPYPSWSLNAQTCYWEPPVPMPTDENLYTWDEETLSWVEVV